MTKSTYVNIAGEVFAVAIQTVQTSVGTLLKRTPGEYVVTHDTIIYSHELALFSCPFVCASTSKATEKARVTTNFKYNFLDNTYLRLVCADFFKIFINVLSKFQ